MIKICLIGIVTVLASLWLKSAKCEFTHLLSMAAMLIISSFLIYELKDVIDAIYEIARIAEIEDEYILILMKMLGITYISEISQDLCKDAGFSTIGNQIEIFAKISIIAMSIPVIRALVSVILQCFT